MDDSNYSKHGSGGSDSSSDSRIFPPLRKALRPQTTKRNEVDIDLCNSEPEEPEEIHTQKRPSSKAQAADALQAERRLKIRQAIARHSASHEFRNERLEILVSKKMYEDRSKSDVLKQLRVVMGDQIYQHSHPLTNLILWRLKSEDPSAPSHVPFCLLVFTAEEYVAHMKSNTLDYFCRDLKAFASGNKIVIAISDMDRYCKQMARDALKNGGQSIVIISKEAVQDSYAFLFMDYGIRTHDIHDQEELSHYICDVSRAVANLPHYRNAAFLESMMEYKKKKVARTTAPLLLSRNNRNRATDTEQNESEYEHEGGTSRTRLIKNSAHVYLEILSLLPGVSLAKAKAIREKYPTLYCLLNALQNSENDEELLSDITFGTLNRRIGRHVSQLVAKVYTSTDPATEIGP